MTSSQFLFHCALFVIQIVLASSDYPIYVSSNVIINDINVTTCSSKHCLHYLSTPPPVSSDTVCIDVFDNLQGRPFATPWKDNYLLSPVKWIKQDFIVPFCHRLYIIIIDHTICIYSLLL